MSGIHWGCIHSLPVLSFVLVSWNTRSGSIQDSLAVVGV